MADWLGEEQVALEAALREFPASLPKDERWDLIAGRVGRSKKECVTQYKRVVSAIQAKRAAVAAGPGSTSAEPEAVLPERRETTPQNASPCAAIVGTVLNAVAEPVPPAATATATAASTGAGAGSRALTPAGSEPEVARGTQRCALADHHTHALPHRSCASTRVVP